MHNVIALKGPKHVSVFAGVGERAREGQELVEVLEKKQSSAPCRVNFREMGKNPAVRFLTAYGAVTIAEYFRDTFENQCAFFH